MQRVAAVQRSVHPRHSDRAASAVLHRLLCLLSDRLLTVFYVYGCPMFMAVRSQAFMQQDQSILMMLY